MVFDPSVVDHQFLIKSRLADEGIDFASSSDLVSVVETFRPQIFNYFSVHGKVVYISKYYSSFVLVCRRFNPASLFGLSCLLHNVHKEEFVVRKYSEFSLAVRDFTFIVEGLCSLSRKEAAEEFSRG